MRALIDTIELRAGVLGDARALAGLSTGTIAGKERFIAESLKSRDVVTACSLDRVIGYITWDRAFFGRPFVWLVGVDPEFRRCGIATRLFGRFEASCAGEPLFTSTNESNLPMHRFLQRQGFVASGRVENIDPGDPEVFYFKHSISCNV